MFLGSKKCKRKQLDGRRVRFFCKGRLKSYYVKLRSKLSCNFHEGLWYISLIGPYYLHFWFHLWFVKSLNVQFHFFYNVLFMKCLQRLWVKLSLFPLFFLVYLLYMVHLRLWSLYDLVPVLSCFMLPSCLWKFQTKNNTKRQFYLVLF